MGWQMAAIKYEMDRAANTLLPNYNTYGRYDVPSYYESYWQSPEQRYYTGSSLFFLFFYKEGHKTLYTHKLACFIDSAAVTRWKKWTVGFDLTAWVAFVRLNQFLMSTKTQSVKELLYKFRADVPSSFHRHMGQPSEWKGSFFFLCDSFEKK